MFFSWLLGFGFRICEVCDFGWLCGLTYLSPYFFSCLELEFAVCCEVCAIRGLRVFGGHTC